MDVSGTHHEEPDATVRVFRPYSRGLPPLDEYVRSLWSRRRFITTLAKTELRATHFDTALGQLWTILSPLMLAGIYFMLVYVLRGGRAGADRFTLLVGCVFLFYFTRNAVQGGARSIIGGGGLILNTAFPRALLPIAAVLESFLQLVPSLAVYAVFHLVAGAPVTMALLVIPLLIAVQAVLNLGVVMLISATGVYFRDVLAALQYLTRLWLYATPVVYQIRDLGDSLRSVLSLNPLFHLFAAYQAILSGNSPRTTDIAIAVGWAVFLLVVGGYVFLSREREFALRL